jgi:hypothetical protein
MDLLLRDGLLVDGSGAAAQPVDVAVEGGRISAVADPGVLVPGDGAEVVNLNRLVLAPGLPLGQPDPRVVVHHVGPAEQPAQALDAGIDWCSPPRKCSPDCAWRAPLPGSMLAKRTAMRNRCGVSSCSLH